MKRNTIYALGFFDGVHLGHQALLTACKALAEKHNCNPGVATFLGHPDTLVFGKAPLQLNTEADRRLLLKSYGMEEILEIPFDKALMDTSWQDFLQNLLAQNGAGFVCGSDFRFGAKGAGTADTLAQFCRERNLPFAIVPQQEIDGIRVSSTHIRSLLESGDMAGALRFLGHPHIFTGKVVTGRGLGHTIGIHTANLHLPQRLLQPKSGVYACKAHFDGKTYLAVTNIGTRPTVGGQHITVEPWLLDFAGDLYGKSLTLSFHAYLREEKKFPSLEALQKEIQKNAIETRKLLEKT